MRIVAALVNGVTSPEVNTVTLLNTAPHAVDLAGWALLDTQKKRLALDGTLDAGRRAHGDGGRSLRAVEQGRRHHARRREGPEGGRRLVHEDAGQAAGVDDRVLVLVSDPRESEVAR